MKPIKAVFLQGTVYSNSAEAMMLFEKQRFGEKTGEKICYMQEEVMYLIEAKKMIVNDARFRILDGDTVRAKFTRSDKRFIIRYTVYCDLRNKGYVPKSALKFGSDFRVYDKGKRVGSSHARWICFCVFEHTKLQLQDFSAQNRVAHSTKKTLLLGVVDSEDDVTYYESSWRRMT